MLNPCFSSNLPLWNVADLADLHKHMEKQQQVSNMGNLCTAGELCPSWPILALDKSFSSSLTARGHPLGLLELQTTRCHCWWGSGPWVMGSALPHTLTIIWDILVSLCPFSCEVVPASCFCCCSHSLGNGSYMGVLLHRLSRTMCPVGEPKCEPRA